MTATGKGTPNGKAAPDPKASDGGDGVFDLDVFVKEAKKEPFRFRLAGREFTAAHMADIDWLPVAGGKDFSGLLTGHEFLKLALGDQWEEFTEIPLASGGYNELQRRWYAHSGVELGESQGSGDSSETTPEP